MNVRIPVMLAALAGALVGLPPDEAAFAAAQSTVVQETLACEACVDLYQVTCPSSTFLLVLTNQNATVADFLVVSGFRTVPAPALGGPDAAAVETITPGNTSEVVFEGVKKTTIKALVSVTSGPTPATVGYRLESSCFRDIGGGQLVRFAPAVKLLQDE
jgi:hypothetical protein